MSSVCAGLSYVCAYTLFRVWSGHTLACSLQLMARAESLRELRIPVGRRTKQGAKVAHLMQVPQVQTEEKNEKIAQNEKERKKSSTPKKGSLQFQSVMTSVEHGSHRNHFICPAFFSFTHSFVSCQCWTKDHVIILHIHWEQGGEREKHRLRKKSNKIKTVQKVQHQQYNPSLKSH